MLIEPRVEVKNVVNQAPSEANRWGSDLSEQGDADAQIVGCVPL
jgi:hypothetical protein